MEFGLNTENITKLVCLSGLLVTIAVVALYPIVRQNTLIV